MAYDPEKWGDQLVQEVEDALNLWDYSREDSYITMNWVPIAQFVIVVEGEEFLVAITREPLSDGERNKR